MKVLLTLFLVSMAAGLFVSVMKYTQRAEFSPTGARTYFHGSGGTSVADPTDLEALLDPGLDAVDETGLVTDERKSVGYLVDVTHPHAFTVPVLYFILFHFLALTRLKEWQKIGLHLYGFLTFVAVFGLPWLVVHNPRWAAAFVISGVNFLVCFALILGILLYETWFVRLPLRRSQAASRS
jgi:hypothetical protein